MDPKKLLKSGERADREKAIDLLAEGNMVELLEYVANGKRRTFSARFDMYDQGHALEKLVLIGDSGFVRDFISEATRLVKGHSWAYIEHDYPLARGELGGRLYFTRTVIVNPDGTLTESEHYLEKALSIGWIGYRYKFRDQEAHRIRVKVDGLLKASDL